MLKEEQKQQAGVKDYLTLEEAAQVLDMRVSAVRYRVIYKGDYDFEKVKIKGARGAPRIMINKYSMLERHPELEEKMSKMGFLENGQKGNHSTDESLISSATDTVGRIVEDVGQVVTKDEDPEFVVGETEERRMTRKERKHLSDRVKVLLLELEELERQSDEIHTKTMDVKGKLVGLLSS